MGANSSTSEPQIDAGLARHDQGVDFIVANLKAVRPIGFAASLFRAVNAIRVLSLQPGRRNLRESQKRQIIEALGHAYRTIYPAIDEHGRHELTWSVNAVATLILIWRGDDPRWTAGSAAEIDARDLIISYEFELLSTTCFEAVVARNTAARQKRDGIFKDMLSAGSEGEPK